jgi:hypothetical protein
MPMTRQRQVRLLKGWKCEYILRAMSDNLEKLERLANLFERGVLSKEEFEAQKLRLLGRSESLDSPLDKLSRHKAIIGGSALLFLIVVASVVVFAKSQHDEVRARIGGSGESQGEMILDAEVQFQDAKTCEPGDGLRELMGRMMDATKAVSGSTDSLVRVAGIRNPLEVRSRDLPSGSRRVKIASIPLKGMWQGLSMTELRTLQWSDGKIESVQLRFREPIREIEHVAKQLGFTLGAAKEDQDARVIAGVEPDSAGGMLTCTWLTKQDDTSNSADASVSDDSDSLR